MDKPKPKQVQDLTPNTEPITLDQAVYAPSRYLASFAPAADGMAEVAEAQRQRQLCIPELP